MPSLRGASFPPPDAGRRLAWRSQRRLIRIGTVSALLFLSSGVVAQGAPAPPPRTPSARPVASAPSDERARVILLVRTEGDEGVMNRVRAELSAGAWRLLELRVDDRLARVPLGELAAQQAVRAAVRFDALEARIELWVFRATGSVEETLGDAGERDEDAVLALRISEALRARGLNLGPEPEQRGESGAAPATDPAARSEPGDRSELAEKTPARQAPFTARRDDVPRTRAAEPRPFRSDLWLELGPALGGSPGGLGPAIGGWVSARLEFAPRWSCSVLGLVPIVPQRLSGPEGTARVSTYFVGTVADAAWLHTPRWELGVGAGVGWAQSEMRGAASSGYVSGGDSVTAITPLARATGRLRLGRRWSLSVGGVGGLALPEVSVKFGDRVAGSWGRPLLLAMFGVQLLAARLPASPDTLESP